MTSFTVLVSGTSLGCIEKGVREWAQFIAISLSQSQITANLSREYKPSVSELSTETKHSCDS